MRQGQSLASGREPRRNLRAVAFQHQPLDPAGFTRNKPNTGFWHPAGFGEEFEQGFVGGPIYRRGGYTDAENGFSRGVGFNAVYLVSPAFGGEA